VGDPSEAVELVAEGVELVVAAPDVEAVVEEGGNRAAFLLCIPVAISPVKAS
jgi:hypothetical protein